MYSYWHWRNRYYVLVVRKVLFGVNFAHMFGQVTLAVGRMVAEWTRIWFETRMNECVSFQH